MATRTERKDASRIARRQDDRREAGANADAPRPAKRRGGTARSRPFGMEMRYREGCSLFLALMGSDERRRANEWRRSWHWYATAARRDMAMAVMNRNDRITEYRPMERR